MAITVNLSNLDDTYFAVDPAGEIVNAFGGNDTLFSGSGNDTFNGGDGNDVAVYAFATSGVTVDLRITDPQDVGGGMGLDTLASIEGLVGSGFNDVLIGDNKDNLLSGFTGDDTLVGGGGNDGLSGGEGADTFKFSFAVSETGQHDSFTGWLASKGLSTSGWTQDFFVNKYAAYLQHLVDDFHIGRDVNGDGKVSVNNKQNDSSGTPSIEGLSAQDAATMFGDRTSVMVKTGKTSHERWYNDSFTIGTGGDNTVKSADGHDQIFDFSLAEHDTLDFSGLGSMDQAKLAATFEIRHEHVNVEGNLVDSTVIALKGDDSFSVALVGVTDLSDADVYGAIHVS
ncbi:MAG: hypothetical protein DMF98_27385 [Acidobacteria bacterium]|nr:MAG: hypothetical protein DMF98_27385 [Acidobacteriota bacterium]